MMSELTDRSDSPAALLTVTVTRCNDAILNLRNVGYSTREYDVRDIATLEDEFDACSHHVTLWSAAEPIATARLTPGPRAVFEQWSLGQAQIPTGAHVVDLSRVTVRPDMRLQGLSSFLILECLHQASAKRFEFVVGATTVDGALFAFMRRIGFAAAGDAVELLESQGQRLVVQPIVAMPSQRHQELWNEMQRECERRLAASGFHVRRAST
jgi:predicted GNAT family N-acyltransferase